MPEPAEVFRLHSSVLFSPVLLRYNWHIILYKFKRGNVVILYMYIFLNDNHVAKIHVTGKFSNVLRKYWFLKLFESKSMLNC